MDKKTVFFSTYFFKNSTYIIWTPHQKTTFLCRYNPIIFCLLLRMLPFVVNGLESFDWRDRYNYGFMFLKQSLGESLVWRYIQRTVKALSPPPLSRSRFSPRNCPDAAPPRARLKGETVRQRSSVRLGNWGDRIIGSLGPGVNDWEDKGCTLTFRRGSYWSPVLGMLLLK